MNDNGNDLDREIVEIRERIDARLAELVPDEGVSPRKLHRSIRYSLLAPGKRFRPVLTVLTAEILGGSAHAAVDPGCAIEMVHAASLIFDDLPAMDDAALRRGRETNHLVFGEDIAMLASIALLNRAFGVVAGARELDATLRLNLLERLSETIGHAGIVAGQAHDLASASRDDADLGSVERVAGQKTAPLFVLGAETGARIAGAPEACVRDIRVFAKNFGLCFQVLDDLGDLHGCPTKQGKDIGQDEHKSTFVSILGTDRALEAATCFATTAAAALDAIGPRALPLKGLTDTLFRRVDKIASGA